MKRILITGKTGSGKTTRALIEAVKTGYQEIAFFTDEISLSGFMIMMGRLFSEAKLETISNHEVLIDECVRVTYINISEVSTADLQKDAHDVFIDDRMTQNNFDLLDFARPRKLYIKVEQLKEYDEVIITEGN